ncbi:MAG: 4-hydroxythreonine-4-phosphate dehydrogenase [Epsilonproteobacteria bacterium]|nr:4-hydroxythreonine-4-phosphate dehydrogenase [Campylobacterota bacterium]NPA56234.1 4-hydroxythreonine-4-phosphate dehydrogenase [Campylobacterota bacterium]
MDKPIIAISIGDLNGVAPEIALRAHSQIREFCTPLYFTNYEMIEQAAQLLNIPIPSDFDIEYIGGSFTIRPGKVSRESGEYSFRSFQKGVEFTSAGITHALVTLPISKEAWQRAGIPYRGHTDYLRHRFGREIIMVLGVPQLWIALYTDHIPLRKVPKKIRTGRLTEFLTRLYPLFGSERISVLGLNPHAGDGGVLGDEEKKISKAIKRANKGIGKKVFRGPLVPDSAFAPHIREREHHYVALYHDQGLIPLKTLYFHEAINVSLGLPIIRSSPDHGTAFDIAYKKGFSINTTSYINAVNYAVRRALL